MEAQARTEVPKHIVLDLIEVDEAAAMLGVSVLTLKRWRRTGEGPAFVKIGRRSAYQIADINEWITSTKRTSTADQRMRAKQTN